jgi:hypothetical protein
VREPHTDVFNRSAEKPIDLTEEFERVAQGDEGKGSATGGGNQDRWSLRLILSTDASVLWTGRMRLMRPLAHEKAAGGTTTPVPMTQRRGDAGTAISTGSGSHQALMQEDYGNIGFSALSAPVLYIFQDGDSWK